MKTLYRLLIEPLSEDQNVQRREVVFNYLLISTFSLIIVATLVVIVSGIIRPAVYPIGATLVMLGLFIAAVATIYYLSRHNHYKSAAMALAGVYAVIAIAIIGIWGFRDSQGIVLLAFFIVMVGILISAQASLYAAVISGLSLIILFVLDADHIYRPNTSWLKNPSSIGDVIGLVIIFGALALVAWLYNREMELSLKRAERSEKALKRQKALLEVTVERRTRQLQAAQAEKMTQLYHFAELGHISTALLHDLSNHLALLTLDIESLGKTRSSQSTIMKQSKQSIQYIEQLVQRVRYQLQGQPIIKAFNLREEISEAMQLLDYKAQRSQVKLKLTTDRGRGAYKYHGDFVGFRQLIGNILTNSIEAYDNLPANRQAAERLVEIKLTQTATHYTITVTDWGKGIKQSDLDKIFNPFYSTRKDGMGIGLFIARQLAENQFKGHLTVNSQPGKSTIFTLELPKKPK